MLHFLLCEQEQDLLPLYPLHICTITDFFSPTTHTHICTVYIHHILMLTFTWWKTHKNCAHHSAEATTVWPVSTMGFISSFGDFCPAPLYLQLKVHMHTLEEHTKSTQHRKACVPIAFSETAHNPMVASLCLHVHWADVHSEAILTVCGLTQLHYPQPLHYAWGSLAFVLFVCQMLVKMKFLCNRKKAQTVDNKTENPPLLFCILISRFLSSHST